MFRVGRHLCGTYAAFMRHLCGTYAAFMRHLCGVYAAFLRHVCTDCVLSLFINGRFRQFSRSSFVVLHLCGVSVMRVLHVSSCPRFHMAPLVDATARRVISSIDARQVGLIYFGQK